MLKPIKTILVSLNTPQFLESNMAMAAQIARQYDSHIIGLYVIPAAIVYVAPYAYGGYINYTEHNKFYRSKASGVENDFREFIRREGLNGEWRQIDSSTHDISETLIEHGRESDLVIIGDDNSITTDLQSQSHIVEALGRPVLFVPNAHGVSSRLNKAIIAWDGSREAARSVFDALPILQRCEHVEITCFNAHKEKEISGDVPGSELANSLARYNIAAEVVAQKTRKSVSKALMERAKTGDLLVMGAYGHSRLLENIIGGVTKKALSEMPCPVLMSN